MRHVPLVAIVLAVFATVPVAAQMPDTPTGRMAGALADLAASGDAAALEKFIEGRVATSARESVGRALEALLAECKGTEMESARKSGPNSATVTLAAGETTCGLDYAIEDSAPHRLTQLGLRVSVGGGGPGEGGIEDLLHGFTEAFNSGEFQKMQAFYAANATESFLTRRSEEEDRELYEMLHGDMGSLKVQTVDVDGPGRLLLGVRAEKTQSSVSFDFELRDGKIQGFRVNVEGPAEVDRS